MQLYLRAAKTRWEKWYDDVGGMGSQFEYIAFNPDLETAKCALLERVYYHEVNGRFEPPYRPEFSTVNKLLLPFTRQFDKLSQIERPVDLDEYPKFYTGRRFELYRRAVERVKVSGFLSKYAFLNSFVKCEKVQKIKGKRSVPRLIQPRKPEYNVCVGRYIRQLEHQIFSMVTRVFAGKDEGLESHGPVIMKGFNTFERAHHMHQAWSRIRNPAAIGLDASRFDEHVSSAMLRWEHRRYLNFFAGLDRKELSAVLRAQIKNKGFIRTSQGRIKYCVDGNRSSGDMNTALGNCLIMCAAVYSLMKSLHIPHRDFALINDGDDCVLIVNQSLAKLVCEAIPKWFHALGFVMKVETPVFAFEDIGFCQTHPVFDGKCWRLVRNFPESLSKDAIVLTDITSPGVYPRYFRSIGDCGLALTYGMPVLQEYYECFRRAASDLPLEHPVFETGMFRLAHGLSPNYEEVSENSRFSFWRAFGLLPDAQIELENYYKKLDLKNLLVYHEPGPRMMVPFECTTAKL